ncbi:MAG TPA: hypothetical protein VID68_13625 [Solirubrobacteraceae bacterium]
MRSRLRGIASREQRATLLARALPRRSDWVLLALIVAAIVVGTVLRVHAIGGNNRVSVDEGGYVANANQILRDHPIATFKWAPGTSLMFAAAAILRGVSHISLSTHSHGVAQYSQLLVEIVTLALVAILAWILAGPWAALIAVALMATYQPLIDITRTYLSEPLGALALLSMVVSICWARKRELHTLVVAGLIAGLAGLVREDYAVAVAAIMLGMLASGFPSRRAALGRALVYGLTALAVVTPFVIYASLRTHRFTPIVDAGPHALFLGTYLPGGGNQFIDLQVTAKQVCDYFNKRRPDAARRAALSLPKDWCHIPPGDAQGLFAMIQAQHPGESNQQAAQDAALHNLDHYMLGRPLSFAHMQIKKAWNMWSYPWSGGNSVGGGGLSRTTSLLQHQIYSAIAWFGIVLGLVLLRRRWAYIVPVLALLAIAWLNTFFAITPRDNVRLMPFVFVYGAVGLATAGAALAALAARRKPTRRSAEPA